ncbi:hypothetical protein CVT25_009441 [Psilocybe cyanescens]|uniref:Uncharacterized protein n=1 Tax=Psilocybe cyanescens TaxID=93625 RepID=A0A409X884_PSICY|nr:hypothetical protein CVT25_009441 [Psilocybe cyanescens]
MDTFLYFVQSAGRNFTGTCDTHMCPASANRHNNSPSDPTLSSDYHHHHLVGRSQAVWTGTKTARMDNGNEDRDQDQDDGCNSDKDSDGSCNGDSNGYEDNTDDSNGYEDNTDDTYKGDDNENGDDGCNSDEGEGNGYEDGEDGSCDKGQAWQRQGCNSDKDATVTRMQQ